MLKHQLVIDDSHSLVLSKLPYYSGQKLTVIVLTENEKTRLIRLTGYGFLCVASEVSSSASFRFHLAVDTLA